MSHSPSTFNQGQYQLIEDAIRNASHLTDCRLHLHLQQASTGYVLVGLAVAVVTVLLGSLIMILAALPMATILIAQLVLFALVFCGVHFTGLKYRLAPRFLRQSLANNALNKVLKEVNAARIADKQQGIHDQGLVLVMVSAFEGYSKVIPSRAIAAQVPESVWKAINNSLMIDVGHGDCAKGMRNSTSAITKLLKVYFPKPASVGEADANTNRLVVVS